MSSDHIIFWLQQLARYKSIHQLKIWLLRSYKKCNPIYGNGWPVLKSTCVKQKTNSQTEGSSMFLGAQEFSCQCDLTIVSIATDSGILKSGHVPTGGCSWTLKKLLSQKLLKYSERFQSKFHLKLAF